MVKPLKRKASFFIIVIVAIVVGVIGFVWWNFRAGRVADLPQVPPAAAPPSEDQVLEEARLWCSRVSKVDIP